MPLFQMNSLASVIPASDFAASLKWYECIFGTPDEEPMEGMAEWEISPGAWLQLDGSGANGAGPAAVVIGVKDVAAARAALLQANISAGEIADYGFVHVCDVRDPDGNRLSFVQLIS